MLTLLLFLTGLFAGTVDAIAGGGGLISLPVLLSMGMPPHIAFGTNKLQSVVGTMVALRRYTKFGLISFHSLRVAIVMGLIGALTGAMLSQAMDPALLKKLTPIILTTILLYTLCKPKLGIDDIHPRMSEHKFYLLFGLMLGFYDGFLGPGTGSLWVFALAFFLGYNLMKASAYTKVLNLNSSFVALTCFIAAGNVDYHAGLIMAAGQVIGGRFGASLAIKFGVNLVKPLFICVVTGTVTMLVYKNYLAGSVTVFASLSKQHHALPLLAMTASCLIISLMAYHRAHRR